MKGQKRWNGRVLGRRGGQSIPIIALVILILFGMVGLAVDVGNTYAEQRKAVNAANAAAVSGMEAYMTGTTDDATIYNAIIGSLESNGVDTEAWQPLAYYKDASNLRICQVGSCGGDLQEENVKYIEVQLQGEVDTFFARVVNQDTLPVNTTTWAAECPPGSSVYPIAVNNTVLDTDTGEFVKPNGADVLDDEWGRVSDGPLEGLTWRRLRVHSASVTGDFGWVRWKENYTGANDLATMLSGDGNLDEGYEELPEWPTSSEMAQIDGYPVKPYQLDAGDWLYGHAGFNGGAVADRLAQHRIDLDNPGDRGTILILPVYGDATGESGEDAKYLVTSLQQFLLTDFTDDGEYITLVAMGEANGSACQTSPAASDTVSLAGRVSFNPEYATKNEDYRPVRYAVVLDVSGSMNYSFTGLGKGDRQCGNAPGVDPRDRDNCQPSQSYAWEPVEERRIYVAKNAIKHLIGLTNMPGNPRKDTTLPYDQMTILSYNSRYQGASMKEWSNDPAELENAVDRQGGFGGDIYKTSGGTNGAAGLYGASRMLAGDNSVTFQEQKYEYKTVVIFLTDGVSNHLFDPRKKGYAGGSNNNRDYFPDGHLCRSGVHIPETIQCHINGSVIDPDHEDRGGKLLLNGQLYDRPITAMGEVSRNYLKNNGHEVHVVAISSIPSNGLEDAVATSPTFYHEAEDLSVDSEGKNNVDIAFENIYQKATGDACIANVDETKDVIESGGADGSGMPEGVYGRVDLFNDQNSYTTVIRQDENGLYYRFDDGIAEGTYRLSATLYYAHPDEEVTPDVPVAYTMIYDEANEQEKGEVTITITKSSNPSGLVERNVTLALGTDICP